MGIKLDVHMYKEHGKWAYSMKVEIPEDTPTTIERGPLLRMIDELQTEVTKGSVAGGHYHVLVRETEEQMNDPAYSKFFHRLFLAVS